MKHSLLPLLFLCLMAMPILAAEPVKLIIDTDMSGDADDAGTLAMVHRLADLGECEILAVLTNRKDLSNASAAAVDVINTYYGRPNIPIGTDKAGPTALHRTSDYTVALRDEFPNDIGPDDKASDALKIYRQALRSQPDKSVVICSVGAFSNLAKLCRKDSELIQKKVLRTVVMGGQIPKRDKPEVNVLAHAEAAMYVASNWPGEIFWQGFDVGNQVMTGNGLNKVPTSNPVRRAYQLRRFRDRFALEGGQSSYDQAAAYFAIRGANRELWAERGRGTVTVEKEGYCGFREHPEGKHIIVKRACPPKKLAALIEALMVASPALRTPR